MKLSSIIFLGVLLAACGSDLPSNEWPDQGPDSAIDMARDAQDLADLDPADLADMQDLGELPDELEWQQFTLLDGATYEGELIAVYDTDRWWNPLGGLLYAVFNASKYALYPNDKSVSFLLVSQVTSIVDVPADVGRSPYGGFLREHDMFFQRPPLELPSYVVTGNDSYHFEEDGYGDFAWDFQLTDDGGERTRNAGFANEDYFVWDQPVISGVRGQVIEVVSNGVDNTPGAHPPEETAINNMVGIALGGSYYAYYLHFREDGVDPAITVNSWVEVGDVLGRTGNSGVSLEPHIHMVLLWFDVDAQRSYAIPSEFKNAELSSTPVGPFELYEWSVPEAGQWARSPN